MTDLRKEYIKIMEDENPYRTEIKPHYEEHPLWVDKHLIASHILENFSGYTSTQNHHDEYKHLAKSIYKDFPHNSTVNTNVLHHTVTNSLISSFDTPHHRQNVGLRTMHMYNALAKLRGISHHDLSDTSKPSPHLMDNEDKIHFSKIFDQNATEESVTNHINHFRNKYNGILPHHDSNLHSFETAANRGHYNMSKVSSKFPLKNEKLNKEEVINEISKAHTVQPYKLIHNWIDNKENFDDFRHSSNSLSRRIPIGFDRPTRRLHGYTENIEPHSREKLVNSWYFMGGQYPAKQIISHVGASLSGSSVSRPNTLGHYTENADVHPDEHKAISDMKLESEAFYKKKYTKDLKAGTTLNDIPITLYRSVSKVGSARNYIPDGAESWTSSKTEARKWVKSKEDRTLLETTVSPNDILWSHETHKGQVPVESELNVKKEHVVLGRNIKNIREID